MIKINPKLGVVLSFILSSVTIVTASALVGAFETLVIFLACLLAQVPASFVAPFVFWVFITTSSLNVLILSLAITI